MNIIVTGGAGYIGSHAVKLLLDEGYKVTAIDNLTTGHKAAIDPRADFYEVDIADKKRIVEIFNKLKPEAVLHFAASSLVGESMKKPLSYYENNVNATQRLLEAMTETNVRKIVFSSTAAIYGEPKRIPILEDDTKNPTNPYGETKLAMERMLHWASEAHNIKFVALRYFNVAGANINAEIGEAHSTETHLIPIILNSLHKKGGAISVYGGDYPTPDGSCVRDYIHVVDLVDAHLLALKYLLNGGQSDSFNLGSENGSSVLEVIDTVERIVGAKVNYSISDRREGDPAVLIASSKRIEKKLGWTAKHDLSQMIESAWKWHNKSAPGF